MVFYIWWFYNYFSFLLWLLLFFICDNSCFVSDNVLCMISVFWDLLRLVLWTCMWSVFINTLCVLILLVLSALPDKYHVLWWLIRDISFFWFGCLQQRGWFIITLLLLFSSSVMSNSLCLHGLQHARLPGTYRTEEFIFQCHIFLPFHTVHGVLKARMLKWFCHHKY